MKLKADSDFASKTGFNCIGDKFYSF